jgi:hypothetical protein
VPRTGFASWLIGGGWLTALAAIVAVSMSMDANVSTTALLLALGVAPAIVIALFAASASPPSVAEILHAVETKDGSL